LSGSDEKLQAKKRERFAEEGGKPINELFFYEIDDKTVHIHLAPAEDFSIYKVRTLFKEGLLKLADIVEVNKDINTICGTSWILGSEKGKSIAEKLGFTFEGINQNNEGEISITREKFLELYLK